MGLKYAGTHDALAAATISSLIKHLLRAGGTVEAEIIDNCLGICALGLSVVLAGSGDMTAFMLIRSKLSSPCVRRCGVRPSSRTPTDVPVHCADLLRRIRLSKATDEPNLPYIGYGAYSSLSQALGFIFLGGGESTFSRSTEAGACPLF